MKLFNYRYNHSIKFIILSINKCGFFSLQGKAENKIGG